MLAHASVAEQQDIVVEHGLLPITPKSIQSIEALNEALERIKVQGHAYAFEEAVLGLGSVAAPIFDYAGEVVASLSIVADSRQFERHLDEYRRAVVRTSNQVSRRLGHMILAG